MFKQCQNLPPGHCWADVQAVEVVTEHASQALWGKGASCISGVRTYLPGTVGQMCKLFKWCLIIPPRHCGAGVQAV